VSKDDKVILIEWENYANSIPLRVTMTTKRDADLRANKFRASRSRRADVLPLTKENKALYLWSLR